MGLTKVEKLIKAFKATGLEESEKIQLDNLDWAHLRFDTVDGQVSVVNEHATEFSVSDLSNDEIKIFQFSIATNKQLEKHKIKKSKKMFWVCSECGGKNVQTKMWISLNTNKQHGEVSDGDSSDNWCEDCESHTDVDYKTL